MSPVMLTPTKGVRSLAIFQSNVVGVLIGPTLFSIAKSNIATPDWQKRRKTGKGVELRTSIR